MGSDRLYRYAQKASVVTITRFTADGRTAFFDVERFPWIAELERRTPEVQSELDTLLAMRESLPRFQDVSTAQRVLTDDDKWKTYVLMIYGQRIEQNAKRCPLTMRAIEAIPGIRSAMFSILGPRKHIPPHGGPSKNVLRCHLALKVPEPIGSSRIRVGDEIRHWEPGRCLIFDDTFEHEVWNDADGERVVLFLDFLRPLPAPASWLNRAALRVIGRSEFAQEIVANAGVNAP